MSGPRRFRTAASREKAAVSGEFADWAIHSRNLTPQLVPPAAAPWPEVFEFALSFDGYSLWVDVGAYANATSQNWYARGVLPNDLDSLRACLFFEQRRYRHFDTEPGGSDATYIRALLNAIRAACAPLA